MFRINMILVFIVALLLTAAEKNRSLRSASEYDYPPFCIVNPDSTAGGFSVELLKAACEAMDINITFKVDEWNVIKQELAEGELDVLPLVGRTPERENIYDFTFPYMTYHGAVFARDDDNRFKTRADLKNAKLMVLRGDNAEEYARRVKLTSDIETVESFETAFKNLSEGRCDIVVTQKVMGLNLINKTGINNVAPLEIDIKDFQQNFCFAVTEGNKKLLEIINEGLSIVIADGTYDRLHRKWFEPVSEIGRERLRIGVISDFPPFSFTNEKGELDGFNIDLIKAIEKQLGIFIEIKTGNCEALQSLLSDGRIDAVAGMNYDQSRSKKYLFSSPFLINDHVIVARNGSDTIGDISDLKGKQIIVARNDGISEFLDDNGISCEKIKTDSPFSSIELLAEGRYDYTIVSHTFAHYYIEKNGIKSLKVIEKSYLPQEYCFAALKSNELIIRHFTDAVSFFKESGKFREIYSKWFGVYHQTGFNYIRFGKYLLLVFAALVAALTLFVVWNRALKNEVLKRTGELSAEIVKRKEIESELMRNQILLKENEEKYRLIYESASEGIFLTVPDEKGTILSANPEACRIFGMTQKEIIEKGRNRLFDNDDPRFWKSLETRRNTGIYKGEVSALRIDGSKFPVYITSKIYKESDGQERSVTIFNDITERKINEDKLNESLNELEKNKKATLNLLKDLKSENDIRKKAQDELKILNAELEKKVSERTAELEKQNSELAKAQESLIMLLEDVNESRNSLEKANGQLSAAMKELEAFSYSVSHDLRAPLRAILGFADILKEDYCENFEDEGKRYIQKIVNNTTKMQKLIDDLLEYSRVGRSSIKPVKLNTIELFKKIFEELTDGNKDRKFDFWVNDAIPDIFADRTLFTQMFQNIIGNAIKFTGKKDISVIKINYENDGKFHIISVKDNGAGFDEKYKHKIFEVFQRLHNEDEFPGTGVGMSIAAKVAMKHGWTVDAESKNGNGAEFFIKIPLEDKKGGS